MSENAAEKLPFDETEVHSCPKCGNEDISYDWVASVTMRVEKGLPAYLVLGGFTDAIPDQIFCSNCGEIEVMSDSQATAACEDANWLFDQVHPKGDDSLANGYRLA